MPRYFFDTSVDGTEIADRAGYVLDDDDAARAKAEAILDVIAREMPGACSVTIRDEAGRMIRVRVAMRAK